MKGPAVVLALIGFCVLSVNAAAGRQLLQGPAEAPADCLTVAQLAEQTGLSSLLQAAELDDLTGTLSDPDLGYTIFAPTNEAFEAGLTALGRTDLQDVLFNSELDPILQYHFLITPLTEDQLVSDGVATTNYLNQTLTISPDGTITGYGSSANITSADNVACNSIVHVIDGVLVPNIILEATAPGPSSATA